MLHHMKVNRLALLASLLLAVSLLPAARAAEREIYPGPEQAKADLAAGLKSAAATHRTREGVDGGVVIVLGEIRQWVPRVAARHVQFPPGRLRLGDLPGPHGSRPDRSEHVWGISDSSPTPRDRQ